MAEPRFMLNPPWWSLLAIGPGIAFYGSLGGFTDGLLLLGALVLQNWKRLWQYFTVLFADVSSYRPIILASAAAMSAILASRIWTRRPLSAATSKWTGPGRPFLFPCSTAHPRLFPKKHSFTYSYLVVGLPVGWEGVAGGLISAGQSTPSSWYHVDASAYLEQGNGHLGLRGKLDAYLETQGVPPSRYPYAYLVTAARFFGYQFNPASFWYLYGPNKELAAMILEENNTLGERRMYFLTPDTSRRPTSPKNRSTTSTVLFTQTWSKDLHASPFRSQDGSYALSTTDPLAPGMQGQGPIDATIVLRSSHTHGKIVAQLFSERKTGLDTGTPGVAAAVDPTKLNGWQKLQFLAVWWWVGLATCLRIVKETGVLLFQRKLHVWFRRERQKQSLGRLADPTETRLEEVFRQYLRYLVEQSSMMKPLAVRYVPCGVPDLPQEIILSPAARQAQSGLTTVADTAATNPEMEEVEFRVLTPAFYTRFVCYAHDVEAFFCELRESCTISVSRPELVMKVFLTKKPRPALQVANVVDFAYFKAIQKLRQRPDQIHQPMTRPRSVYAKSPGPSSPQSLSPQSSGRPSSSSSSSSTSSSTTEKFISSGDLRGFRLSAMDGFVLAHSDSQMRRQYRVTVLLLFLANRTTLGVVPLFQALCFVLRGCVAWAMARLLLGAVAHEQAVR